MIHAVPFCQGRQRQYQRVQKQKPEVAGEGRARKEGGKPRVGGHRAALAQSLHVPSVLLSSPNLPYMELDEETALCSVVSVESQNAVRDTGNAKYFEMENVSKYEMFFEVASTLFLIHILRVSRHIARTL